MSVKTKLSLEQINGLSKELNMKFSKMEETSYGLCDTVYILTSQTSKKYILKLYESSNEKRVLKELDILKRLDCLRVSKPIYYFSEFEKPMVLYSFIDGDIPLEIKEEHLKEIASFLKKLHSIDCSEDNFEVNDFEINDLYLELLSLYNLDEKIKKEFLSRLKLVQDVDVRAFKSIIHGDIFPDNTKFIKQKLSGVFDFSQISIANRYMDIATVINSWCFDKDGNPDTLLSNKFIKEYDCTLTLESMGKYLLYVNLYYALKRYINIQTNFYDSKVSYKEYLQKFDSTLSLIQKSSNK